MIALDTAVLVYWTLDPEQLSQSASKVIEEDETKIISAVSIWELGQKIKSGDLRLPLRLSDYLEKLKTVENLEITPVDAEHWMRSLVLNWDNEDIADRLIVATSMLRSCTLVSADPVIRDFYSKSTW
tara:strand:+ start:1918 stop:2298 length:381 start_codon:yes stop_codon:yes gene_type:complete